ncbi:hypothetical protein FS837_001049 [Tulasnella sp. UAMH 9824]|nr:hypothetical protein FS837_001049 [Tulasnella sp. UAMH 9824]
MRYLAWMAYPAEPDLHSTLPPPAIQRLPEALFINIVQLYINPLSHIRDLIRLTLVCQPWRMIVEGTPSLWCRITADEPFAYLREGMQMSKKAHLYLYYDAITSPFDAEFFFEAIGPHIARWKSLVAALTIVDFPLAELETKPAPMETARDIVWWSPRTTDLKDVRITALPIALQDLLRVETKKLKLGDHPSSATTEIARHMAQQIISNISAPNLHKFQLKLPNTENPRINILPALTPLIPNMKAMLSDALAIGVIFGGSWYGIRIGKLGLYFQSDANNSDVGTLAEDLFGWLAGQLGARLLNLPVTLYLGDCPTSPLNGDWLSIRVKVTRLSLYHRPTSFPGLSFDNALATLSKPSASPSAGWLLPHLETLKISSTLEGGNMDLVNMISARRSAANHSSQPDERTPTVPPKSFREIQLWYGGKTYDKNPSPDIDFMWAVQNAAGDDDVYWAGVKWGE